MSTLCLDIQVKPHSASLVTPLRKEIGFSGFGPACDFFFVLPNERAVDQFSKPRKDRPRKHVDYWEVIQFGDFV